MIVEPIQGVGGFTTPPDGLFGEFKKVLDEYGILLVSDEVQTGWGRTGEHFWGIQAHDVVPDAITFAKGLGNGLAIGGVVARAELMDCLRANSISTFGGNPISTAGALATLNYLLDHDLQANAAKLGSRLLDGLRAVAAAHPVVGDVRGKGLMIALELVGPGRRTQPRGRRRPAGGNAQTRAARRQGRPVRQRHPPGAADDADRGRGRGGARASSPSRSRPWPRRCSSDEDHALDRRQAMDRRRRAHG